MYKWWIEIQKTSDQTIDPSTFETFNKWHDPPLAVEILEMLDKCVYNALCSDFVIFIMRFELEKAIERENTSYEDVVKIANSTWRKELT